MKFFTKNKKDKPSAYLSISLKLNLNFFPSLKNHGKYETINSVDTATPIINSLNP